MNIIVKMVVGAIIGVASRLISEAIMFVILNLVAVGLAQEQLWNIFGEYGFFLLALVISSFIGGSISSFIGALIWIILRKYTTSDNRLIYICVFAEVLIWPLIAILGYLWFNDVLFLGEPHPLQSFILWPIAGVVIGGITAAVHERNSASTR